MHYFQTMNKPWVSQVGRKHCSEAATVRPMAAMGLPPLCLLLYSPLESSGLCQPLQSIY
jgi:hypothetical protein